MSRVELTLPTIRVGRSPDCEIEIPHKRQGEGSYVSRKHCCLFKWTDQSDYEIMDGIRGIATVAEPDPIVVPSQYGTWVNNRKLGHGEKQLLKNGDRVMLVPSQVELVYLRAPRKRGDANLEVTYVPVE